MLLELAQEIWQLAMPILAGVGITSVTAGLAFLVAYYAFPPNVSVEEVKDKGSHNFESRLVIKNIGKLPAFNIIADVEKMNLRMGGLNVTDMTATNCGGKTAKLAHGEKTEIPACPHVGMPVGTSLDSCDYLLILKYQFKLPFYSTVLEKRWHVELRNSGKEFVWQTSMK